MTGHLRLREALRYVPLALVLPLLWVASEGEVAVKPVAWVVVAAVAAVGLRCAFGERLSPLGDWVLAGLLGLWGLGLAAYYALPVAVEHRYTSIDSSTR